MPPFQPAAPLAVDTVGPQSVTLRSRRWIAELSVLAADLFRLRLACGKLFSTLPSWAVARHDWPAVATRRRTRGHAISLLTKAGRLTFHTDSARWELGDARGRLLLGASFSGFGHARAQVTLALRAREAVHGLGEMTGPLDKRGLVREFWNADVLGHASCMHAGLRNLYVSIPFGISLRAGHAAGIFWDNPARQAWGVRPQSSGCS